MFNFVVNIAASPTLPDDCSPNKFYVQGVDLENHDIFSVEHASVDFRKDYDQLELMAISRWKKVGPLCLF